ncbi:sensor histidine kinase [Bacteroidota bacterium]
MLNPILSNKRFIFYYYIIWTLVIVFHIVILFIVNDYSFVVAIVDSAVYTLLFSVIGLAIWFVIKFSYSEKGKFIQIFFTHIAAALVTISFWIYISDFLCSEILFSINKEPIKFAGNAPYRIFSGVLYYSFITFSYYLFIYYNNLTEKSRNEARLETIIKETELKAIKSQINPHFLFNSLNSISSLTISDPKKAKEMIINLSEYLRYSISHKDKQLSNLKIEIENCQKYLEIEKIRFGSKLDIQFDHEESCLTRVIPSMILQPLYENAIKHGVYESTELVKIKTKVECKPKHTEIIISNNFDPEAISRKGEGFGLRSIKDRLMLIYNSSDLLHTRKTENHFEVRLLLPLIEKEL